MRNINIFRTTVRDHQIPREIMVQAIMLSPGQDWTDPKTQAYQHIKKWALEQDKHRKGAVKPIPAKTVMIEINGSDYDVPMSVFGEAEALGALTDKRTLAYKHLKKWALEQDKRDEAGK